MENMCIYNQVRSVPETAKKDICAGRLKGKTDINPMWRIKTLTTLFGPCGTGWYYTIERMWLDDGGNKEIIANVVINLFYKQDGEWSSPVIGIGGSMFTASEKNGIYTDDECYKKALTDAISVACKALGIGADVYWDKDTTKYDSHSLGGSNLAPEHTQKENAALVQPAHIKALTDMCEQVGWSEKKLIANTQVMSKIPLSEVSQMNMQQFMLISAYLQNKIEAKQSEKSVSYESQN